MASLATTDKCPYCLQNINQGQSQYGPICNNGHRAHLNCIMKQFEHTGSFNIDTWTCPLCRAPAFYDPDPNSETPSLNQVLRDRFPRRIAKLEERGEELGSGRISIDELSQQYPFLSSEYRENEQDYVMAIMNVLSRNVRMNGVFPHTSQFQDTEDAENMGNILLTQWYEMYNMATAYEDEGDMEDYHSTLSNQSDFFRMLTMAVLLGSVSGFWNLDTDTFQLLTAMRRRAAEADGTRTVNFHGRGGKRKKKKTRRKRRGKKRKTRKKRGAYLSDLEDSDDEMNNEQGWGADTEFLVKNDEVNINAFLSEIRRRQNEGSYVIHSPSDELGLEFLHSMMMESLLTGEYVEGIYGVTYAPNRNEGPYGRFFADYFDDMNSLTERLEIVSENNRFPNSVTQLQSAVEEQIILPHPGGESPNTIMEVDDLSGGRKRRRKKKTRKKKNRKRRTKKKSRKPRRKTKKAGTHSKLAKKVMKKSLGEEFNRASPRQQGKFLNRLRKRFKEIEKEKELIKERDFKAYAYREILSHIARAYIPATREWNLYNKRDYMGVRTPVDQQLGEWATYQNVTQYYIIRNWHKNGGLRGHIAQDKLRRYLSAAVYHGVKNGDLNEYPGAPGREYDNIIEPTEQANRKVFGSNYEEEYAYGKFVDDSNKILNEDDELSDNDITIAIRYGLSPIHAIGLGDLLKAKNSGKMSNKDLKVFELHGPSLGALTTGRWGWEATGDVRKFIPDRRRWHGRIWLGDSRWPVEDLLRNLRELSKKYKETSN